MRHIAVDEMLARMAVSERPRVSGLRRYQAHALHGLLDAIEQARAITFTVMFPRQAGKNEVSACLVAALLHLHAERGGSVVVCAPTGHPQAAISLERTWRVLRETAHLVRHPARRLEDTIAVGRARAVFLSASTQAHVAGHTASLALVADEAQDIDRDWFDRQFRPMAASTGAPTVLLGTAWDGDSLLERAAAANRRHDAAGGRPRRHYQVSWHEVAESVPAYGEYVRHERARLGAGHPLFLSQYELVAARQLDRLFSEWQLAGLEGAFSRETAPAPGHRYVAGLDFGGDGREADATVLTVARLTPAGCDVVDLRRWQGTPYETLTREVLEELERWRPELVAADATGMGGPLTAQLEPSLGQRLKRVHFTAQVKSDLGFTLLACAGTGRLRIFRDDGSAEAATLRRELRACRSILRSGGMLSWGHDGGHDDTVVSLALCVHAAQEAGPARVARGRAR